MLEGMFVYIHIEVYHYAKNCIKLTEQAAIKKTQKNALVHYGLID